MSNDTPTITDASLRVAWKVWHSVFTAPDAATTSYSELADRAMRAALETVMTPAEVPGGAVDAALPFYRRGGCPSPHKCYANGCQRAAACVWSQLAYADGVSTDATEPTTTLTDTSMPTATRPYLNSKVFPGCVSLLGTYRIESHENISVCEYEGSCQFPDSKCPNAPSKPPTIADLTSRLTTLESTLAAVVRVVDRAALDPDGILRNAAGKAAGG